MNRQNPLRKVRHWPGWLAILALLLPLAKAGVAVADLPPASQEQTGQPASESKTPCPMHMGGEASEPEPASSTESDSSEHHDDCCGSSDCQCTWSCAGCGKVPIVMLRQVAAQLWDRFRTIDLPEVATGPLTGVVRMLLRPPTLA